MAQQGDLEIYGVWQGKPLLSNAVSKSRQERANFIITYKGHDWSGYRTLAECMPQFTELAARPDGRDFTIVER